jgi:hypothetical protein
MYTPRAVAVLAFLDAWIAEYPELRRGRLTVSAVAAVVEEYDQEQHEQHVDDGPANDNGA